ncbi:MAG: hypothetical protein Q7S27_00210 [Nanoarchaeota archaeon]|nr:hypothetical protein [Nanoarchaeota archaeon]
MGESRYSGELYIIIPRNERDSLHDITALRMVGEINNSRRINNIVIKEDEKFSLVEKFCNEKDITLNSVAENFNLIEELTRYYGEPPRRFVYLTRSESQESLSGTIETLADWGFYSEFRIPNSF